MLDTGGWLGLTRQGLSPCKKRQVYLGARTGGLGWGYAGFGRPSNAAKPWSVIGLAAVFPRFSAPVFPSASLLYVYSVVGIVMLGEQKDNHS